MKEPFHDYLNDVPRQPIDESHIIARVQYFYDYLHNQLTQLNDDCNIDDSNTLNRIISVYYEIFSDSIYPGVDNE